MLNTSKCCKNMDQGYVKYVYCQEKNQWQIQKL